MPHREVIREDLVEERFQTYGFNAVFAVGRVQCCHCPAEFRAVSRPHRESTDAIAEAIVMIRKQGWRGLKAGGTVCPDCHPSQKAEP